MLTIMHPAIATQALVVAAFTAVASAVARSQAVGSTILEAASTAVADITIDDEAGESS